MDTPRPMAIPMPSLVNRYPLEAAFARQLDGRLSLIMWVIRDSKFFANLPGESNELATLVAAFQRSQDGRPLADPGNIVARGAAPSRKGTPKVTESGERAPYRHELLAPQSHDGCPIEAAQIVERRRD